MFPVVGPDGIARALFHYHLLELDAAGIEEICIIVQPGEDEMVRAYLRGPDRDYLKRLEKHPALLREAEQMKTVCRARHLCRAARNRKVTAMRFIRPKNLPAANSCCSASATISSAAGRFRPIRNWRKWRRYPVAAASRRSTGFQPAN